MTSADPADTLVVHCSRAQYTLADLRKITDDLDWLYRYSARATLADTEEYVGSRSRRWVPDLVVGKVQLGSLIFEFLANYGLPAGIGTAVLANFKRLLEHGPDFIALPHRMREAWYNAAFDAEQARRRLERLRRRAGEITVHGPGIVEPDLSFEPEITLRHSADREDDAS